MTPNDHKMKIAEPWFHVYQMKASNPGHLKIEIEYFFNLLVTSYDP